MRMDIDGACHCGAVRYEANIETDNVVLCHCTDCQAFSGAPYRVSVPVLIENFTLHGEPQRYVKIGGSGDEVIQRFCGTCGASLFSYKGETPPHLNLRIGGVRQRARLTPKLQGFCESAMPWAWDIRDVRKWMGANSN